MVLCFFAPSANAAWIFIPDAALANPKTKITVQNALGGKVKVRGSAIAPLGVAPVAGFPPIMIAPPVAGAVPPAVPPVGLAAIAGVTPINTTNAAGLGITAPVIPAAGALVNPAGVPIVQFTPLTWLQNIDPVVSSKLFAIAFGLVVASAGLARSFGLLFSMFTGRH